MIRADDDAGSVMCHRSDLFQINVILQLPKSRSELNLTDNSLYNKSQEDVY